jgi:hypothetical protein
LDGRTPALAAGVSIFFWQPAGRAVFPLEWRFIKKKLIAIKMSWTFPDSFDN